VLIKVTNDVRREATELLEEMKLLTAQQDNLFDDQNNSTREVARLQAELRDWKSRYSQLKIQVRSTASSISSASNLNNSIRTDVKSRLVPTEDGIIEDATISRFQNSIDELLAAARRDDNEVLDSMTEVVKATRAITDNIKRHGDRTIEEDPKVRKLTTRLSATANNLITATKNHASSHGLSPVSLVDAAASHLTSTVIDLVKVVKLRPASGTTSFRTDEDAQSDASRYSELATPITSPMGSLSPPSKSIPVPLTLGSRSNIAPRTSARREEYIPRSPESVHSIDSRRSSSRVYISKDEEELRVYLDSQTQAIVESIQTLLTRIRNPKLDSLDNFRPQIDEIIAIVEKIVAYTERQGTKIDRLGGENGRMMTILHSLEDCCSLMRNVARPGSTSSEDGFKKRLARIAFDISKQIKVLPLITWVLIGRNWFGLWKLSLRPIAQMSSCSISDFCFLCGSLWVGGSDTPIRYKLNREALDNRGLLVLMYAVEMHFAVEIGIVGFSIHCMT
jgi:predicted  nucleic acid-binding Zn-ribbon protein